jgi:hypothetical protein
MWDNTQGERTFCKKFSPPAPPHSKTFMGIGYAGENFLEKVFPRAPFQKLSNEKEL